MAEPSTLYEVTVTFVIDQPDFYELDRHEIEDNVRMAIDGLGTIGYAPILPQSINASVDDDVAPEDWR